jgi:hypothetical protein
MALKRLSLPSVGDYISEGQPTKAFVDVLNDVSVFIGSAKTLLDGTFVDCVTWEMIFVEDGDYTLILNSPYSLEIDSVTTDCDSGTCTATIEIDGTPLGGTANSVSSTETTQSHTSDNEGAAGCNVTIAIASNAGCEKMRLSVKFRRPLIV